MKKNISQKKMQRFHEYGFAGRLLRRGRHNLITDVPGVKVGHTTIVRGDDIRTGVTIVDPGIKNLFHEKVAAAVAVGNGFGKLAGISQIEELGTIETPIALTNTLAVGPVMRGVVDIVLADTKKMSPFQTVNAVVGETNDGLLNDIHQDVISKKDVADAWATRTSDCVVGAVGAGSGTRAFSWKGGIGSASRMVEVESKKYTVGALLQTNFGGALTMLGVPVGLTLGKTDFDSFRPKDTDGSCMIVLATDAPLSSRMLGRIARRAFLGLARTGAVMAHGSGDYAIAFSTAPRRGEKLSDDSLTSFFLATVEAVEESVYDALFAATTTTGVRATTLEALPKEKVIELLRSHGK